jgi:hypothetical protein
VLCPAIAAARGAHRRPPALLPVVLRLIVKRVCARALVPLELTTPPKLLQAGRISCFPHRKFHAPPPPFTVRPPPLLPLVRIFLHRRQKSSHPISLCREPQPSPSRAPQSRLRRCSSPFSSPSPPPRRTVSPHLLKPCLTPPPLAAGAPSGDLTTSCPLAGCRRPRHHADRVRGDRAPSACHDARMARVGYSRLGLGLGQPGQAGALQVLWPWAKRAAQHCLVFFHFCFVYLNLRN